MITSARALLLAVGFGLGCGSAFAQKAPAAIAFDPAANGDVGPADAPVTMVVFTDFACPYSAKLFYTVESLESAYPKQLHVILKQSPLSIHPEAPLAHRAALAAGRQGQFTAMAELLYANQAHLDRTSLLGYARQLKLNLPRFERDMDSPEIQAKLSADMVESHAFGVTQTPMTFLNGRILLGTQTRSDLASMIEKAAHLAAENASTGADDPDPPVDQALLPVLAQNPIAEAGSPAAPLTIVEFTDFQCPFCKAAVEPLEKLVTSRGREVRWVFRAYPLDFHPDSQLATEAALAAGEQGKFWPMHDLLFAHQDALKLADLQKYADQLGLNRKRFDDALATHKFAGQIASDRLLGTKAGVNGTPTFIVDGQRITGVRSLLEWNQIADAHVGRESTAVLAQKSLAPVSGGQVVSGSANAPVTLAWYTDVRSPLAAGQAALVRELLTQYGSQLRVVYRAFPVATREDSELGGEALVAAAQQGKFWQTYDLLAARRDVLDRTKVAALAGQLGLDSAVFNAALDETKVDIAADVADAARRGIQGVPVIFINAQRVDGLQRTELYTRLLNRELSSAPLTAAAGR